MQRKGSGAKQFINEEACLSMQMVYRENFFILDSFSDLIFHQPSVNYLVPTFLQPIKPHLFRLSKKYICSQIQTVSFVFMKCSFMVVVLTLFSIITQAQEKWSLRKMVDYAMTNNISVKQADVQARIAALQVKQAELNKYPTANFSPSVGVNFGRSIDPTSNQFTTQEFFSNQFQLQGGATIFSFGRLKYNQQAAQFSAEAALKDVEKAVNDVALNVAVYYLQVLASNEQVKISKIQIAQTTEQLSNTKKRVDAGALPELNLAELQAQLATDSSNYIAAKTSYDQNILTLKGLLNIDASLPFDVETPDVDLIPILPFSEMEPETIYQLALTTQPLQQANDLRIKATQKNIAASKAALYPSLSGFYSLGSSYNNKQLGPTGDSTIYQVPTTDAVGKVNVNGTDYNVYPLNPFQTISFPNYAKTKYFNQLSNNFNQGIGISINVPIFNNGSAKLNYERSKLDLKNFQLQQDQANQTLKLNIYTAYTNAINSLEKYNAGKQSVSSAQKAFDYAQKRYEVGLLSTIDLITNQNNLLRAKLQQLSNHYDYVFKMKLLEFYKGEGLKL